MQDMQEGDTIKLELNEDTKFEIEKGVCLVIGSERTEEERMRGVPMTQKMYWGVTGNLNIGELNAIRSVLRSAMLDLMAMIDEQIETKMRKTVEKA